MQTEQVAEKQNESVVLDKGDLSQMFTRNAASDDAHLAQMHDKQQEFKLKQHNVTVGDKADEYSMIKTNAHSETGADENSKEAREKKQKERDMYRRILDDLMRDLDDKIKQGEDALQAGKELRDLYENGTLDYNNKEHSALMSRYGITKEQIERDGKKAFDERDNQLIDNQTKYKNARKDVEQLDDKSPKDIEKNIRQIEKENGINLSGFDEDELAGITDQKFEEFDDVTFSDEMGSFASSDSELSNSGIKAAPIKDIFKAAHDNTIVSTEPLPEHSNKLDIALGSPS